MNTETTRRERSNSDGNGNGCSGVSGSNSIEELQ
jgi:hypothetical protein